MSYGRTRNRGHGRRKPAHVWIEDHSFLDRRDRYYPDNHWSGAPALALSDATDELIVLLVSIALHAAGWLLKSLFTQLLRIARRRRGQAEAFEETCRQHLRRRRTECVRGEPKPEQLLAAWEESRTSLAGKLRLGALLSEIEPHVDQSLIRDEGGHIVGRRPGILGWLRWNCPELVPHYKAIMAYKALADKVQMAVGLQSKYSIVDVIDVIIEFGEIDAASTGRGRVAQGDSGKADRTEAERAGERADAAKESQLSEPRKRLGELLRALRDAAPRVTLRALDDEVRFRLGLVRMRRSS